MSNADPCVLVIFGASGDLTRRKLLPALYNLSESKLLPDRLAVLGVPRPPEDVAAIGARAAALLARVPEDAAFQRQPHDGRGWSVGQCFEHLNNMNQVYFGEIRRALEGAPHASSPVTMPIRSSWFGRWFIAEMGPGRRRKLKSPGKVVPRSSRGRDEVAGEFFRGLDEIESTLRRAEAIDLNGPTFASPFFRLSRVRAGTGFRILLTHMHRHLEQAEQALWHTS